MSEYTRYCAVPNTQSQEHICDVLKEQKLHSVVDDAAYLDDPSLKWIVVEVSKDEDLHALATLFGKALLLFVEEDWKTWELTLKQGTTALHLRLEEGVPVSDEALDTTASFFGVKPSDIKKLLQYEKQIKFCEKVGLPYLELLDQRIHYWPSIKGYSVLAKECD